MDVIPASIYDYPKYYDLLFGSDWRAEFNFLRACFAKHAARPVRRLFEPACGTGRLIARFAQAGYEVSGNDLNCRAVEYCNARLQRRGLPPSAVVGDMADFRLRRKVDAAFNLINSFRHLSSAHAAEAHLVCVAAALAKGGIYVLGFHLTPQHDPTCDEESWSARRGGLSVSSHMWSIGIDRRRRRERVGMTLDVTTPSRRFRLADETIFRTYTADQFLRLLDRVPDLELDATYDFDYQIERPIVVDGRTEDVIYVLRKS
jgi:SAM-dependent methyltransferase